MLKVFLIQGYAVTLNKEPGRQIAFRKDFGLVADPGIVSALIAIPPSNPSRYEWDVILSDAEYQEMLRRIDVGESVYTIRNDGLSQAPNEYAGVWMDHLDGGKLKVGYTGNMSQHLSRIQGFFPYPNEVEVVQSQFSYNQLAGVQTAIEGALTTGGIGMPILSTDIDEELNLVRVGVSFPTSSQTDFLTTQFGPSVLVEHASLPSESDEDSASLLELQMDDYDDLGRTDLWPTMRGGIQIGGAPPDYDGPAGKCTLGWIWGTWAITAGHCVLYDWDAPNNIYLQYNWWQPVDFGGSTQIEWEGTNTRVRVGDRTDAAAFPLRSGLWTDYIYRKPGQTSYTITSNENAANDFVGGFVEKAGAVTDYSNGKIKSRDYCTWGDAGRRACYLRRATQTQPGKKGDSGGPVFRAHRIVGIIGGNTASDADGARDAYYSHIGNILDDLW